MFLENTVPPVDTLVVHVSIFKVNPIIHPQKWNIMVGSRDMNCTFCLELYERTVLKGEEPV